MALTRKLRVHSLSIKSYPLGFLLAPAIQKTALFSNHDRENFLISSFGRSRPSDICCKQCQFLTLQFFSTSIQPERICWEFSSHSVLLRKLEFALKNHQLDEAWETFNDFKSLYGYPDHSMMSRFANELSYSSNPHWLQKTYDLVFVILKEKSEFLKPDILTQLSLSLARAQMPIPASTILRLMLVKKNLPPMNVLRLVVLHMVRTEIGTYLASNFLVQICDCFLRFTTEKSDRAKLMKPDTMIFNLVLNACVRFGSSLRGQEIMELMSQAGVIADAHSINNIAQIHEMNGQRDELKKFKDHIDQLSVPFVCHYRQFYDSLLSLHFKFDDIDAAAELVLDMHGYRESHPDKNHSKDSKNPCLVSIGSPNLRSGLKIHIVPKLLQKDSVLKVEGNQGLVTFRNGKLLLSNRALAKLIYGYKRRGKTSELSKLLLRIQEEYHSLGEFSLRSDVIDACIHLGWLETAHDILDDMELAGYPMSSTTYMLLMTAYYKGKMFREAKALLKQMRKISLVINLPEEMIVSTCLFDVVDKCARYTNVSSSIAKSNLAESLVREMRDEKAIPAMVYEFNSSIYFFCKAKMIGDALKTYQRMQEMKIQPVVQTFAYLVYGYSSLDMYRDITILWGDIKRSVQSGNFVVSRDLCEALLLNFLRGGYFERVMEVIDYMKERSMYTDKWMYKSEFLKFHKNLYKTLKASEARTEAQSKRLEYVRAFRKWVGIN